MLDKERYTSHLNDPEEQEIARRILDQAEIVLKNHEPRATIFLNPYQQEMVENILRNIPDLKYRITGGYPSAERKRIVLVPDYYMWDLIEPSLAFFEIKGNFQFQRVTHRDFLGALLGLGIKREFIGDILVQRDGCQVIVAKEIAEAIIVKLQRVHEVPVEIFEIEPEELRYEEPKTKEIRSTVPSLRLDAVASSGFSVSRSQMARLIKAQQVKLNWKPQDNPAASVKEGDIISVRGKGRVQLTSIEGESRRGRLKVLLKRYI